MAEANGLSAASVQSVVHARTVSAANAVAVMAVGVAAMAVAVSATKDATAANHAASAARKADQSAHRLKRVVSAQNATNAQMVARTDAMKAVATLAPTAHQLGVNHASRARTAHGPKVAVAAANVASAVTVRIAASAARSRVMPPNKNWPWPTKQPWPPQAAAT